MTIIDYGDNIHKDTVFARPAFYIGNGVGCGTVWYDSSVQARKIRELWDEIPNGWDSGYCAICTSHDAVNGKVHLACSKWKMRVANGEITSYETG